MARKSSYADFTDDWEKMITNVIANAAELPDLAVQLTALQESLAEVRALGARQQSRRGLKQTETEEHKQQVREGKSRAAKLRAALKAHYGFTSPRLHEYGILPLGVKRRRKGDGSEPPEEPEQPKSENPASAAPDVQPAPQTRPQTS